MKNQIFIIGSGFSKDFNEQFPILTNLTNKILEYCNDDLAKTYVGGLSEGLRQNTENLFSYLYSDLPWKKPSDSYINKGVFHALSVALSNYFIALEDTVVQLDHADLRKLAGYWNENESTIITFNYDTLIEKYLTQTYRTEVRKIDEHLIKTYLENRDKSLFHKSLGLNFVRNTNRSLHVEYDQSAHILRFILPYDSNQKIPDDEKVKLKERLAACLPDDALKNDLVSAVNSNLASLFYLNNKITEGQLYQCQLVHLASRTGSGLFADSFEETKTAKLYKLHGSINWYYTGTFDTASEPIYYSPAGENAPNSKEATGLIPVIIPPLLQKDSYYQNTSLKSQWQNLVRSITESESPLEFYFVGYSFPTTDFLAWSLFSSHLPSNKPYRIYLVNCLRIEDGRFDKSSQHLLDYYFTTFLPNIPLDQEVYSDLIKTGAIERNQIIFDISLSKIIGTENLQWQRTPSTIQNLTNKLKES